MKGEPETACNNQGSKGGLSENIRHLAVISWRSVQRPARILPGGSGACRPCVSQHITWHGVPCSASHVLLESNLAKNQQHFSLS